MTIPTIDDMFGETLSGRVLQSRELGRTLHSRVLQSRTLGSDNSQNNYQIPQENNTRIRHGSQECSSDNDNHLSKNPAKNPDLNNDNSYLNQK